MTGLFQLVQSSKAEKLAIVGMTKNVGKTVTLNYLIGSFSRAGKTLGLVSAGYDGERFDRLTLKEKPRIHAPAGSLVATAKACFDTEAELELLYRSEVATPLGEVCLGRVKRAGLVELAGPGSISGLNMITAKLKQFAAGPILVDGAINRLASAAPTVTESAILATGAAVGVALEDVVRKTVFRLTLLETPRVEDPALHSAAKDAAIQAAGRLIIRNGASWRVEAIHAPVPLLVSEQLGKQLSENTAAIVLGGALVDQTLAELCRLPFPIPLLIVRDATKMFISHDTYSRFIHRGGRVRVLEKINLIGVTLNPTDPAGKGYEASEFYKYMCKALAPCPVFDLVLSAAAAPAELFCRNIISAPGQITPNLS